jgi:hypothetical protein
MQVLLSIYVHVCIVLPNYILLSNHRADLGIVSLIRLSFCLYKDLIVWNIQFWNIKVGVFNFFTSIISNKNETQYFLVFWLTNGTNGSQHEYFALFCNTRVPGLWWICISIQINYIDEVILLPCYGYVLIYML